ncbi:ABC transporter substrate-binding protein [Streptomyces sp. XM4193]|nr:ABC transporter substrate-binding protein [Streptomyces sp. XM4193]
MRGKRGRRALWITVLCMVVLAAAGFTGRQLLAKSEESDPIVVGSGAYPTSLDPAAAYDDGSWALYSNIYQGLLTFSPGSAQPVPDAAERCGFVGRESTVYRCTLRKDLRFSNGDRLTTHDVRHSIERITRIKHEQGPAQLFDTLDTIRTRGQDIEFRLKTGDATFPFKLAGAAGSIVPSGSYPEDGLLRGDRAIGSGPFELADYRAKKHAELVPNDSYRGAQDKAPGPVELRWFTEAGALKKAWEQREIDVNDGGLPPAELAELSPSDPDITLTEHSGTDIQMTVFNTREDSATAERPVRQAIATALDRQRLARKVHVGTVEPLYSLIPQGMTGHGTPFFDRYPEPDTAAARKLLEEADVTTPVEFDLAYSKGPTATREATEIKRQLEATKLFEVDVRGYEWDDFLKGMAKGTYDAYNLGWVADYPDPDTYTGSLVTSGNATQNGFSSEEIDGLVAEVQRKPERDQTVADYRKIHERIAQQVPMLPLWQAKDYVLTRPGIGGSQHLSDNSGIWRLWKLERL